MSDSEGHEWPTNRERISYEEGRHVLEAQKSDIDDMDDKALRTVRVTALLLGVGATGVRVIGIPSIDGTIAGSSLASFLLSLLFGVTVYNESNELIGPKADYLGRLRRNDLSAPWEQDLLVQFEGWIADNQTIVERNGYLLIACQLFFVLGVLFGTAGLLGFGPAETVLFGSFLLTVLLVTVVLIETRVENGG